MIDADTQGHFVFLAKLDQWNEFFLDFVQFFLISLWRIDQSLKFLFIGIIAWIYADFFHMHSRFYCGIRGKMNISR